MNKLLLIVTLNLTLFVSTSLSKEVVSIVFSERVNNIAYSYIDKVKEIYRNVGVEPLIKIYPESRSVYLFNNSKVDSLGIKIEEFETKNTNAIKVNFPIYKDFKFKAFVLKEDLKRVQDLKNPFVVTSSACLGCLEYSKLHNLKISSYFKKLGTGVKLLKLRRADIIIASEFTIKSYSNKIFVPLNSNEFTTDLYHFISKKKSHLKGKLEEEFRLAFSKSTSVPNK